MTAKDAGRTAVDGVWTSLKTLRERWIMVVFVTGALIWARDTYEQLARLPAEIGAHAIQLKAITNQVTALEQQVVSTARQNAGPVVAFPGDRHGVDDAKPGEWTNVRFSPVDFLREDCRIVQIDAFMEDSTGNWFSVETGLDPAPVLDQVADLAFEVRVHPRMARGRARAVIQLALSCDRQERAETAPPLPFRVVEG